MTFVVLALFGSTLVGIVHVVIALVGIAPVGIGTCTHSQGPSEQKPFKILGENRAWAYPGTAKFF